MKVINVKDLTPEQVAELRTPIPHGDVLKKTFDIGVGAEVAFEMEDALVPARATQEFRQAIGPLESRQLINMLGREDMEEPAAKFVFRLLKLVAPDLCAKHTGKFKGWDVVRDTMTAAQSKHAYSIAVRLSYYATDDMPKDTQDFFSEPTILMKMINVESAIDQLKSLDNLYQTVGVHMVVMGTMFDKINELSRRAGADEMEVPKEGFKTQEKSENGHQPDSSSTDSPEEDHPTEQ